MTLRPAALALLLALSVACGGAPASRATTPSAAARAPSATGFSVVGLTAVDAVAEPRLFRMNASTLALVMSTSRSWSAFTLDPRSRRLSAMGGAANRSAQEYVTSVRGMPDDAFIGIDESAGRATVRVATMHATGGQATRQHQAMLGVSEWANGQRLLLRGGDVASFMDLPPQRFELVGGTGPLPAISPKVRYAAMVAFPSGHVFALGRPVTQAASDSRWFMYVHDGASDARTVPLPERLGDPSFVDGMSERFLAVLLRDAATGASHVARWDGAAFALTESPLDADIVQGSPQGTVWQASTRARWLQSTSAAGATKRIPLPESAPCAVESVTSLVALQDDDVWLGVLCQCASLKSQCTSAAVLTNAHSKSSAAIDLPSP